MIRLFTIGFTEKGAQQFFELLEANGVRKIIDTRISNNSQLAGFAKAKDLEWFAKRIAGIEYEHRVDLAPTEEMLKAYRGKQVKWDKYTGMYLDLLQERDIKNKLDTNLLDGCCLLCSEHLPEKCHRRLLAEYLQGLNPEIEIIHLV